MDAPGASSSRRQPGQPQRLGKFVLQGELGRGGMGVVYRAFDEALKRPVAIKVLTDGYNEAALARFRRELAVIARLRHPSIVAVHEATLLGGSPAIVMDLVHGVTLDQALAPPSPGVPLPFVRALEVVRDAARALHFAHEQGVVHRDVKPQNVMLDEGGRVVVVDFGLAAVVDPGQSRLTRTDATVGTPAYLPPEQISASGAPPDRRSDVYGLGATLYHVLTGQAPFVAASGLELLAAVLTTDPAPPGSLSERARGDLETICLRCLEKDPARRYETAAAVADELDRYLAGAPIQAPKPAAPGAASRRRVAVVAVPLLVSAALAGAATWQLARARDERAALEVARVELTELALAAAEEALRAERWSSALALAEQARRGLSERDPRPRELLARIETGRARAERERVAPPPVELPAVELRAATSPPADGPGVLAARGKALADGGDLAGGLALLDRAVEHYPDDEVVLRIRGELRLRAGHLDGAVADHTRAAELVPARPVAWSELGAARRAKGDLEGAVVAFTRAIELDPTQGRPWYGRGEALLRLKRLEEALADLNRSIALEPLVPHPWNARGEVRVSLRDLEGAQADFSRVIELLPDSMVGYAGRASARALANDHERSLDDISRAIALAPENMVLRLYRAVTRRAMGDDVGALEDLELVFREGSPMKEQPWYERGLARVGVGDLDGAVADLERALELAIPERKAIVRARLDEVRALR